ncbi:GNAT family N-acetyltransferase [Paraburkholderia jirisanensis]
MSEAASVVVASDTNRAHPLDAVIWHALTGRQRSLAVGDERAVRFATDVAPFGAIADTSAASFEALRSLVAQHGSVALVTPGELAVPSGFSVARRATLSQMVWQGRHEPEAAAEPTEYVELDRRDVPDMLALTAATQPGPFGPRTIELGRYLGVRKEGKLAAMAGERLKLDGFTEISAVCVNPAFRGQGLAGSLMQQLIAATHARGETPFLHVFTTNHTAVALYRRLGFEQRHEMHLTVLDAEHE